MGKNAKINRYLGWLQTSIFGTVAVIFFVLATIQIVFLFIARDLAHERAAIVQSFLSDRRVVTNPYLISMRVEDLETQGLLGCTQFRSLDEGRDFIDLTFKSSCERDLPLTDRVLFLRFVPIRQVFAGPDGRSWELSSRSLSSSYFKLGLWASRLTLVIFVLLVSFFTRSVFRLRIQRLESEARLSGAMIAIASQVAHDIRSPLAALKMAAPHFNDMPEDLRVMLNGAIQRINDIANELLRKNRETANTSGNVAELPAIRSSHKAVLLSALMDSVVSEKRLEYRSKFGLVINEEFDPSSYGLYVEADPLELKRIFSNLVNNAVEAFDGAGRVLLSLRSVERFVDCQIRDNGKGISPAVLKKLGAPGESHGKIDGSGLGLYHARTRMESWGGSLHIESEVGQGTAITLRFPSAKPPSWFAARLALTKNMLVAVVDDDFSIHRIWKGRLESSRMMENGIKLLHFSTLESFSSWLNEQPRNSNLTVLMDYEFSGEKMNGLDLIAQLGIVENAILVTSRYEESQVIKRCESLRVRLIPKGMAGLVPIELIK